MGVEKDFSIIYDVMWVAWELMSSRGSAIIDNANFEVREDGAFSQITYLMEVHEQVARTRMKGYDVPGGVKQARRTVARYEGLLAKEDGFDESHVVLSGGGCTGALDNLLKVLSRESNRKGVVIPVPAYSFILGLPYQHNCRVDPVYTSSANNFKATQEEIEEVISDDTLAIMLTSPGNPACVYYDEETLLAIEALAERHGAYLIVDSIYEDAKHEGLVRSPLEYLKTNRVIKIKGPSKDRPGLNGLRAGYLISRNKGLIGQVDRQLSFSQGTLPNTVEEVLWADNHYRAILHKLDTGELSEYPTFADDKQRFEQYAAEVREFRRKIGQGVNDIVAAARESPAIAEVIQPEAGNIIFMRANYGGGSWQLMTDLSNNSHVGISPGLIFGYPDDEPWFRVTVSREPELIQGILESNVFSYLQEHPDPMSGQKQVFDVTSLQTL